MRVSVLVSWREEEVVSVALLAPGEEVTQFEEAVEVAGTEGKVLVDQRRLVQALECYGPDSDRFYCCWPDCGWGGPGTLFDKGERQPHSGDCPGRESVP